MQFLLFFYIFVLIWALAANLRILETIHENWCPWILIKPQYKSLLNIRGCIVTIILFIWSFNQIFWKDCSITLSYNPTTPFVYLPTISDLGTFVLQHTFTEQHVTFLASNRKQMEKNILEIRQHGYFINIVK